MRKLFILFIICFPGSKLFAQGGGEVLRQVLLDSLKVAYKISTSDTQKAELNMRISELYAAFEPDSSIFYGEKGLILARNTDEYVTEIGILGFLAGALIYKGDYPKALELCLEADRIREKNLPPGSNETLGIGPAYCYLVLIFEHIGEYEKALYYSKRMSEAPISDIITVAYGNYYSARIHEKMNNIDSALHRLNTSLAQFLSFDNYQKDFYGVHPELYNLRSYIYLKQGKKALALQDFNTSLELSRRTGFVPYTSNTLIDLSNYYQSIKQSDSVIYYAERALEEAQTISYTRVF